MLQRSLRLQEAGYYTGDGTPAISYKETLYRIFYRRRTHCGPHNENVVEDYQDAEDSVDIDSHTADCFTVGAQVSQPCVPHTWSHQPTTNGTQRTGARRTRVPKMCRFSAKNFSFLLLVFLLAFGFILIHGNLRVVHQELLSLRQQMDMFVPLADTIPNFGARVIQHLSSHTYWPREDSGLTWRWMFNWWYSSKAQRRVIQGHSALRPGQCWCFAGEQGHLFVSLSHPVSDTESAPGEFSIYGARTKEEAGTYLGTLVYDLDGATFQTFSLSNPDNSVFKYVKLQTKNNWGHMDYTCLYSFRVHGKLPSYPGPFPPCI